jgi:AcrR family transcriptional regulator
MKLPSEASTSEISTAPRKVRADGERTRKAILETAVDLASVEGLGVLTIGRLARHVGMSKSGLFAHFGSKEELQLAVVEQARQHYMRELIQPVLDTPPGLRRLEAMCEGMLSLMERRTFPGICFFTMVRAEFCARQGRLHDDIADNIKAGHQFIVDLIEEAQAMGELKPEIDSAQLAFEIEAICDAPNWTLHDAEGQADIERARIASRKRIVEAKVI